LAPAYTNLNKTEIAMHERLRTTTNLGRPTARCPVHRLRPKLGLGAESQNADCARGMWRRRRVKVRRNSLVRPARSSGSSSDPVASENPCTPPNPYWPVRSNGGATVYPSRCRDNTCCAPSDRHQEPSLPLQQYFEINPCGCACVRYGIYAPLAADGRTALLRMRRA